MDDDVTASPTTSSPTQAPTPRKTEATALPIDQIMHHLGVDALIYDLDDGPLVVVPHGPEDD